MARRCSRPGCRQDAVCTLTYVYRDSTAVLGPLAAYVEPHCYDLCDAHAGRLTAPLGWDVVRLPVHPEEPLPTQGDDLERWPTPSGKPSRPIRPSPWGRASRWAAGGTCGCSARHRVSPARAEPPAQPGPRSAWHPLSPAPGDSAYRTRPEA